ncbi:MAG: cytochrome P460 family protein [Burkholderiales bacterium]
MKDNGRFSDTGGWGFEGFKGGDASQREVAHGGKACFGCHVPLKTWDSFSASCVTDTAAIGNWGGSWH